MQLVDMARERLTVSLDTEVYEYLAKRAEKEVRTIPNLIEFLCVQEMERQKSQQSNQDK